MTNSDSFHKMLGIVNEAHKNHKDENGNPLIFHLLYVTVMLSKTHPDPELLSAALGQKLLEKTDITIQFLLNEGISYRTTQIISILTKDSDISYSKYKQQILEDPDAARITFYTLSHQIQTQTNLLKLSQLKSFRNDIRLSLSDNRLILSPIN